MKHDPIFGWEAHFDKKEIRRIEFNTGITVYFYVYSKNPSTLQSSTVPAIFGDEEMPESHYDELVTRLATDGYLNLVFTATIGQEMWYRAIERRGKPDETFVDAFKQQISLYDCLVYMDGTPSTIWTEEKIEARKRQYHTQSEIDKRIYGRFVKDEAMRFPTFHPSKNCEPPGLTNVKGWPLFVGADAGSGGRNHPAAIVVIAVAPDFTAVRVIKSWRGDGIVTTAQDIVNRISYMIRGMRVIAIKYDYAGSGKDLGILGARAGLPMVRANKDRDLGFSLMNALIKSQMLMLVSDDDDYEMEKLVVELQMLPYQSKRTLSARDDLSDALRYALSDISFAFRFDEYGRREAVRNEIDQRKELRNRYRDSRSFEKSADQLIDEIAEMFDDAV